LRGGAENGIKKIVVDGALPPTLTWQDLSRKRSSFSSKSNRRKRIKHSDYKFYRFELDSLAGYFQLFGTYYYPDEWPERYGLDGEEIAHGFVGQTIEPFTKRKRTS
jgi:hypothetical protein